MENAMSAPESKSLEAILESSKPGTSVLVDSSLPDAAAEPSTADLDGVVAAATAPSPFIPTDPTYDTSVNVLASAHTPEESAVVPDSDHHADSAARALSTAELGAGPRKTSSVHEDNPFISENISSTRIARISDAEPEESDAERSSTTRPLTIASPIEAPPLQLAESPPVIEPSASPEAATPAKRSFVPREPALPEISQPNSAPKGEHQITQPVLVAREKNTDTVPPNVSAAVGGSPANSPLPLIADTTEMPRRPRGSPDETTVVAEDMDTPWANERVLKSGRGSDNPEYLMGHLHSVDNRDEFDDLELEEPVASELWDEEVLALEKQLAQKLEKSEDCRERLELLKSKKLRRKHYIETLATQFRSLQLMKVTRLEEVETGRKQVELKRRETAHVHLEIIRTDEQAKQLVARCTRDQAMMARLKKEIVDMQTETELDRELMGACLDFAEKHQTEYNLLQKYCAEDDEKIKDCLYRIGRIALEDEQSRKDMETLEVELKSVKLEVARIQESCREADTDRSSRADNWNKIRNRLKEADADIERLHGEIDGLGAKQAAKEEAMRRQREFYEAEYRNNQEARKKMEITEINAIKARAYVAEMEKRKQELIDQTHVLNNACSTKSRQLRTTQANITELRNQTKKIQDDIRRWNDLANSVTAKEKELQQKNLTDEERLAELNKALDHRELLVRTAEQSLVKLRDQNFKTTQQNLLLKAELDAANVNVQGNNVYISSLQRQMRTNRGLAHSQAQQMYELQYKVTQLNRRISFMEGTDAPDKGIKYIDNSKVLEEKRENIQKEIIMMRTRTRKQDEFICNLKKSVDQEETLRKKKEIALAEIMLHLHTTQRSLEQAKVKKVDNAVELSSSRLKLRYIADKTESKLDTVTSMSIRQVELGGLFKERMAMVQMEREQYKAQTKRVDEQRSWLIKMLRELENHQRGVKTRYETLTMPMSLEDREQNDARDVVQIQASLFVKAAREKQKINNQKNQLKQDIQKVMDDNFRLRRFYERFEKQTNQMKGDLQKVKQTTELHEKQQAVENETSFLKERIRAHEGHIYGYQQENVMLRNTKEKMVQLVDQINQNLKQDREELKNLVAEVDDQKKRLTRTATQNSAMMGAIKKSKPAEEVEQLKADIEVNVSTDVERLLFSTISRFLHGRPDTVELVSQLFQQMAIEMSEELTKLLLSRSSVDAVGDSPRVHVVS